MARLFLNFAVWLLALSGGFISSAEAQPSVLLLKPQPVPSRFQVLRTCRKAHVPIFITEHNVLGYSPDGTYNPYTRAVLQAGRSPEADQIVEGILSDWKEIHHYTTDANIEMLRLRNRSLSPMRSTYLSFESTHKKRMGLRIFDGSSRVLREGEEGEWVQASRTDSRTPLEISDPNIILPERKSKEAFLWELGLLNVDPELIGGIRSAFVQVAHLLDHDYNGTDFRFFGRTDGLKEKKMMIYAQTREAQVQTFEKHGLLPVLDANGKPTRLASGLILIASPADRFVELNYMNALFSSEKSEAARYTPEELKRAMVGVRQEIENFASQRQQEMKWLDEQKISDIRTYEDLNFYWNATVENMYRVVKSPAKSSLQEQAAMVFMTSYYRFINSIPPQMRAPGWSALRKSLLMSMTSRRFTSAYFHLYRLIQFNQSQNMNSFMSAEAIRHLQEHLPILNLPRPFVGPAEGGRL